MGGVFSWHSRAAQGGVSPAESPSPSSRPQVLVVGAGPTGIVLACELLRRGITVRLVDAAKGPATTSRAFTVHSRTLEAFDAMGISAQFLGCGLKVTAMAYHFIKEDEPTEKDLDLPFNTDLLPGLHPFVLNIPQTTTERILRDHLQTLGGHIEWSTPLTGFTEDSDGSISAVLDNSETVRSLYLVGCDGARSFVRKHQSVEFAGLQYAGTTMKMMDVSLNGTLNEKYSHSNIHYFIKKRDMVLLAKLNDDEYDGETDIWRVIVSARNKDEDVSVAEFQSKLDDVVPGAKLGVPQWISCLNLQKRMVSTYRSTAGRVLLAGDSAHIHSPAGGQGMNVCIQDAFNLGWKLAMVCNGLASEKLLGTYQVERLPVGEKVLEGSDLLHKVILAHGQDLQERIKTATAEKWIERAVMNISGQAYKYCKEESAEQFGNAMIVRAGLHAPDLLVKGPDGLAVRLTALHAPYYVLIELDDETSRVKNVAEETYGRWVKVVKAAPINGVSGTRKEADLSRPSDRVLRDQYGTAKAALVRPDGYIDRLFTVEDTQGTILEHLKDVANVYLN